MNRGGTAGVLGSRRPGLWSVVAVLVLVYLFTLASDFEVYLAGIVVIYAISALGLEWLTGRTGQVSVGNAAIMGVGAYTTAVVIDQPWAVFPVPTVLAMLAGALVGLVIGLPALRLSGLYLALATFALHFIFAATATNVEKAGNLGGLPVGPLTIAGHVFGYDRGYLTVLLLVLALCVVLLRNMFRGRPGREWRALAESPTAASAIGVDVVRLKLSAFVGSSMMIAVSGSLLAYYLQNVSAATFASIEFAASFVIMIIVGGRGRIAGAIVGAAVLTTAPEILSATTATVSMGGWIEANIFSINAALYGVLLLLVLSFYPKGLVPLVEAGARRLVRRRRSTPASAAPAADPPRPAHTCARAPQRAGGPPALLSATDLTVVYRSGSAAVGGVGFEVRRGRLVALLGPNGAGKTSVLRAVGGFLPTEGVTVGGSVRLDGTEIAGLSPGEVVRLGVGVVPERDKVLPSLTVDEHLRLATGRSEVDPGLLDGLGALADRRRTKGAALSGGERQMLAIACALAREPRLLLVDELSLGLAPRIVMELLEVVQAICRDRDIAVLIADQSAVAVTAVADEVHLLGGGLLTASGTPGDLAARSALDSSYFAGLAAVTAGGTAR